MLLTKAPVLPKETKQLSEEIKVEQQVTTKHLRRLKTSVKGKDPELSANTERAVKPRGEDAETAGETRGIIRQ